VDLFLDLGQLTIPFLAPDSRGNETNGFAQEFCVMPAEDVQGRLRQSVLYPTGEVQVISRFLASKELSKWPLFL